MNALTRCKLFEGIELKRIIAFNIAINALEYSCGQGEVIIHQGESTEKLGVVLRGEIEAIHYRADGSFAVVAILNEGEVFADFLAADDSAHSPATISARSECRVLLIKFSALFQPVAGFEAEQRAVLANLSKIYAEKYFELKDRLICISAPTLRGKIINYLSLMSEHKGSDTFTVPFDREGMAAYLNADRSALSRELAKMKNDGIIEYYKNSFKLKKW